MTKPAPITILAISAHNDAHLPIVQQFLDQRMVIIDPLAVVVGLDLSYLHQGSKHMVTYKGSPLQNVRGIWYRKPTALDQLSLKIPGKLHDYTNDALQQYSELIRAQFLHANWISDYYAIKRAENKSLGLNLAQQLGMRTPDTLFTSDQVQAKDFIARYPTVIIKPLSRFFPLADDKTPVMFFAHRIERDQKVDLNGLHLAPAIFQEAIDAAYDIRVSVVGNEAFASKITNPGLPESPVRDWRQGHFTGTIVFEAYPKLAKDIADKCVALTKKLGLAFGTIDLVRDKKGRYWLLEINPNGQWAFVDDATANNIGKAIAKNLSS